MRKRAQPATGAFVIQITSQWCIDGYVRTVRPLSFTDNPRKAKAFPSMEAGVDAGGKLPAHIADFAPPTTYRLVPLVDALATAAARRAPEPLEPLPQPERALSNCERCDECAEKAEQVIELATMQKLLDDNDRETQILDLIVNLHHLYDQLPASDDGTEKRSWERLLESVETHYEAEVAGEDCDTSCERHGAELLAQMADNDTDKEN